MIELEWIGTEMPSRIPAWCQDIADAMVKGAAEHPDEWALFPHTGTPSARQAVRDAATFSEHFRAADGYLILKCGGQWIVRYQEPQQTGTKR